MCYYVFIYQYQLVSYMCVSFDSSWALVQVVAKIEILVLVVSLKIIMIMQSQCIHELVNLYRQTADMYTAMITIKCHTKIFIIQWDNNQYCELGTLPGMNYACTSYKFDIYEVKTHQNFLFSKHRNKVWWQIRRWSLKGNVDMRINRSCRSDEFLLSACRYACSACLPSSAASLAENLRISSVLCDKNPTFEFTRLILAIFLVSQQWYCLKNGYKSFTWFESPFPLSTFVRMIKDCTCPARYCAIVETKNKSDVWRKK